MRPKEKADQLINKFTGIEVTILGCGKNEGNPCVVSGDVCQRDARQLAVVVAEEMINEFGKRFPPASETACLYADQYAYWVKVKEIIQQGLELM